MILALAMLWRGSHVESYGSSRMTKHPVDPTYTSECTYAVGMRQNKKLLTVMQDTGRSLSYT